MKLRDTVFHKKQLHAGGLVGKQNLSVCIRDDGALGDDVRQCFQIICVPPLMLIDPDHVLGVFDGVRQKFRAEPIREEGQAARADNLFKFYVADGRLDVIDVDHPVEDKRALLLSFDVRHAADVVTELHS